MLRSSSVLLVLAACCSLGCGSSSPFDYIPVSGKITYDDGTPIPASGIRLGFRAIDAKPVGDAYPRPAEAVVDAQGNFGSATSYKPNDGLVPGKHKVTIAYATDAKGKLLVAKEYTDGATTPLVVDTASLPLDIKVPRP